MNSVCPVCGQTDVGVQGVYRGRHGTFAGLQLAHCRGCDLVFAAPMPSEAALVDFNANYFDSAHGGQTQDQTAVAFFAGIARLRSEHLERYLAVHGVNVSKLLEIGPGPGYFARSWLERHSETSYLALETDRSCHDSLRQAGVSVLEQELGAPGAETVDLVVLSHVLEHVSDPRSFLEYATRSLRPGGALFIEVPCRDWEHKPLDEPHLLFLDKQPMRHLLDSLGFGEIQVSYHGREIEQLRSQSWLGAKWLGLRARLIAAGFVGPFGGARSGMESLTSPLQRAVLAPYMAHVESSKPAWWLRALAVKRDVN